MAPKNGYSKSQYKPHGLTFKNIVFSKSAIAEDSIAFPYSVAFELKVLYTKSYTRFLHDIVALFLHTRPKFEAVNLFRLSMCHFLEFD